MARLREVPFILRTVGAWPFAKRVYREIGEDGVFNMAAAVAYYWLLALFPLMIFLASLASILPGSAKDVIFRKIGEWIYLNLTEQAAFTVWSNAKELLYEPQGGLLSIGLLLTLWAASNGVNATMTAMDRCYNVTRPRPYWQQRGISIAITLCGVVIALLVGILLPVTSIVLNYLKRSGEYVPEFARGGAETALNVSRYSIGVTLVILLVSSIYHFGISIRRRWTLVTPGAIFAVFGVMAMAYGFNWYIQHFGAESYNKTYGALGGVVILLLLFYLYAVVFLIGAEINSEIDFEIAGLASDATTDPLPHIHRRDDVARFRRQAELRRAKRPE